MKTINGQVQVINETFEESLETFNDILTELGTQPIDEAAAREDFGIVGGETNAQLDEYAHDYVNELHTESCEASAFRNHNLFN